MRFGGQEWVGFVGWVERLALSRRQSFVVGRGASRSDGRVAAVCLERAEGELKFPALNVRLRTVQAPAAGRLRHHFGLLNVTQMPHCRAALIGANILASGTDKASWAEICCRRVDQPGASTQQTPNKTQDFRSGLQHCRRLGFRTSALLLGCLSFTVAVESRQRSSPIPGHLTPTTVPPIPDQLPTSIPFCGHHVCPRSGLEAIGPQAQGTCI